jgi:hypothetical protein
MKRASTLTILFLIVLKSSLFAQRQFQFYRDAIKISYTAQTLNVTTFSFSIIDTSNGVSFSVQNFSFSISDTISKINIGKNVENIINATSQIYTSQTIDSFSSKIDIMCETATHTLTANQLKKPDVQGLFISRAMIKALKRRVQSGYDSITCKTHEGFIRNMNSYVCEEDLYLNVQNFISYINANTPISIQKGGNYVLAVLSDESANEISFSRLKEKLAIYFENTQPNKLWPSGHDCGCCGNYDGPCLFWSVNCLAHDYMCQTCSPSWFCLPGCQPTPCAV